MSRHMYHYGSTASQPMISSDSPQPMIELWQRFLVRNGQVLRSGCDDGVWGSSTQSATAAFRAANGFVQAPAGIAIYQHEVPAATRLGYGSVEYQELTPAEKTQFCPQPAPTPQTPSPDSEEEEEEDGFLPDIVPDKLKGAITEVAEKVVSPEGAITIGAIVLVGVLGSWLLSRPGRLG